MQEWHEMIPYGFGEGREINKKSEDNFRTAHSWELPMSLPLFLAVGTWRISICEPPAKFLNVIIITTLILSLAGEMLFEARIPEVCA